MNSLPVATSWIWLCPNPSKLTIVFSRNPFSDRLLSARTVRLVDLEEDVVCLMNAQLAAKVRGDLVHGDLRTPV